MEQSFIILDRDGVINHDSDDYVKAPEEWHPIPGSIEAVSLLTHAGFTVLVATNQAGIGYDFYDEYDLARMHEKMQRLVERHGGRIAGVFYCPHTPEEDCRCRKPRTGLIEQMEEEFGTGMTGACFIGDSEKDLDCAMAKGCRPVLVLTGNGGETYRGLNADKRAAIKVYDDLFSAASDLALVLRRKNGGMHV